MKNLLHALARNNALWNLVWLPLAKLGKHMTWQRSRAEFHRFCKSLAPEYRVQAGPFKGMRYPSPEAVGSSMIGKLLGNYEAELIPWVEAVIATPYDVIVDVGCAEGYYAVGLAKCKPESKIYAFDLDPRARELCQEMAALNEVSSHVTVGGLCEPQALASLVAGKKALIISDCEGGESDLFTAELQPHLAHSDVLIECHDFIVRGISDRMKRQFAPTHACYTAYSMLPMERAARVPSPLIKETSPMVLEWLYNEGRPETMQWLLFTPRD